MSSSINHLGLQEAFESGRLRAQWTTYLLMGDAFFSLASITVGFFQIKRFSAFKATERLAEIEMNDLDTLEGVILFEGERLISLAGMIVFLATAVLFVLWIYRAARNLRLLGASDLHYSPRLAVGSFFIPFANLFIPYRLVKEIWRRSETRLESSALENNGPPTPAWIGWWWESWVFSGLVASITWHPGLQPETVNQRLTLVWLNLISEAFLLLAAVLAIRLIRAINNRQTESSLRLPNLGQPPPSPIFD